MFLGIEIGGTKLQLGVGPGDGVLASLWRGKVDVAAGPDGIRRQITAAVPELLTKGGLHRSMLRGVGVGFGGPVDDSTHTVIKSHQIAGWDEFPLAAWVSDLVGLPAVLGNDADVAGLAEALHGAGKGLTPIFYITIGSGIGGGLVINGEIYRGVGRGAAEIGHLKLDLFSLDQATGIYEEKLATVEDEGSGWGIERNARRMISANPRLLTRWLGRSGGSPEEITIRHVAAAAARGDGAASLALKNARKCLAHSICTVIALLCPRRIVIGGGVSLMGEELFFAPLRGLVAERVFRPFVGLTDIVPAALGEEVVVHGALSLARKRFG